MLKIVKTIILAIISICNVLSLCGDSTFTPKNTDLVFDADQTLIDYGSLHRPTIVFNALLSGNLIGMYRFNQARKRNNQGEKNLIDQNGQKVPGGVEIQAAYVGCKIVTDPKFTAFVPTIAQTTWDHTHFKPGALDLLFHLKDKGYKIMVATNKDHVSYEGTMDTIRKKYIKWRSPIDQALVVQPDKEWLTNNLEPKEGSDQKFIELVNNIKNATETDRIEHSQFSKPDQRYYDKLAEIAEGKKVIFFDDKQENVDAAELHDMTAFITQNVGDMAMNLIKIGILDPAKNTDDAALMHRLARAGAFGRVAAWKAFFAQLFGRKTIFNHQQGVIFN